MDLGRLDTRERGDGCGLGSVGSRGERERGQGLESVVGRGERKRVWTWRLDSPGRGDGCDFWSLGERERGQGLEPVVGRRERTIIWLGDLIAQEEEMDVAFGVSGRGREDRAWSLLLVEERGRELDLERLDSRERGDGCGLGSVGSRGDRERGLGLESIVGRVKHGMGSTDWHVSMFDIHFRKIIWMYCPGHA